MSVSAPLGDGSTSAPRGSNRFSGITDRLMSMTVGQRIIASLLTVLIVGGGIFWGIQASKPTMSPLFTGLSSSDASAVVDQLKSSGVQYQLQDGGTTILVPENAVYEQRLSAASAGLPSGGGTGYALLDNVGLTSSEFQQDTSYKRAIEGELASTIMAMSGVDTASVKIATPKETIFAEQQEEPTASVFVDSPNGLNSQQVQAIVHLTSASVEGMTPNNVAVVDSTGKVLSAVGEGVVSSSDGDELTNLTTAKVQNVLSNLLGPGNATVAVNIETSRATEERVAEEFKDPAGGIKALTESTDSEEYSGTGAPAGTGVLGPDNVANTGANASGNNAGEYKSAKNSKTNAVDKTTTKTNKPAGDIQRQTISVAVNRNAANGVTAQQIGNLVSNAAGINEERGDAVSVEILPFSTASAEEAKAALAAAAEAEKEAAQQKMIRDIIIAGIVAGGAIVLFLVWMIFGRRRTIEPLDTVVETPPSLLDRMSEPEMNTGQLRIIQPEPETITLDKLESEAPTAPVAPQPTTQSSADKLVQAARTNPKLTAEQMSSLIDKDGDL